MNRLLVCWDLVSEDSSRDYRPLIDRVRQYGTYACIQYSTYVLYTAVSARAVRDDLAAYVDENDRLFVAALTGETAWLHMPDAAGEWLHRYVGAVAG